MRKYLIPALLWMCLGCWQNGYAQKTGKTTLKKPTKKVAVRKAPARPVAPTVEASELLPNDDGTHLYMGGMGDQLVYEVNAAGKVYDFIVTLRLPSDSYRYVFDWEMTPPVSRKGRVSIAKEAAYDSRHYLNFFSGGNSVLTDACTVWLTGANFSDMPEKKTTLELDNNGSETFYRKDEAETNYTIMYKGNEVKLDIFKIDNDKEGGDRRQLWVQGISSFPLIVKMDLGWTIRLKEIR